MSNAKSEELLREEFNRWADAGKGESMESDHWPITRPVLEMMHIRPTDNILDVGCGGGWLSKILARGGFRSGRGVPPLIQTAATNYGGCGDQRRGRRCHVVLLPRPPRQQGFDGTAAAEMAAKPARGFGLAFASGLR